ncbi:MAG: hypothetical protein D6698_08475 [Gammaproteobacteria bacterium]|nr:MAG: hypothetical protein D6698_08475 [Gammaproteobacteria bacterium]
MIAEIKMTDMGFENFKEFLNTAFGVQLKKLLLTVTLIATFFIISLNFFRAEIEEYIYAPATSLYILLIVVSLDWVTAAIPALKRREFSTRKAQRIIPVLTTHTLLLSLIWHAEKTLLNEFNSMVVIEAYRTLRIGLTNYIFFIYLLSALTNASKAGWIKWNIVKYLSDRIDSHKLPD